MKRSEIIKLGMKKLLYELPRDLERGIKLSGNDRYMVTSLLLECFEEAGMFPPNHRVVWGDDVYYWEDE